MSETPTPRTDAEAETRIVKGKPREIVNANLARQLERELAEAKSSCDHVKAIERENATLRKVMIQAEQQRDRLADALRGIASGLYSWQCCVDEIAPQAIANLAAVEGGSHE